MKTSIQNEIKKKEEYPKLMKQAVFGIIVLFEKESCGITLHDPRIKRPSVGSYSTTWSMGGFEDFDGEVVISN